MIPRVFSLSISFFLIPILIPIPPSQTLALAQESSNQSFPPSFTNSLDTLTTLQFMPPADDGEPDTTRGAGSRGNPQCFQDLPSDQNNSAPTPLGLTALVPSDNYGLTQTDRPTFWVYLPATSARQIILSLREQDHPEFLSQTPLPITGEAGVIGIPMSAELPSLEIGKTYQWAVVLVCGEQISPNDPAALAWVHRKAPNPLSSLVQRSPLEQARWYGKHGIWYDALTSMALARQLQPDNSQLFDRWREFLSHSSLNLDPIASEALQFPLLLHNQLPTNTNAAQ